MPRNQVTQTCLTPELLAAVDVARGQTSRSTYIAGLVAQALQIPLPPDGRGKARGNPTQPPLARSGGSRARRENPQITPGPEPVADQSTCTHPRAHERKLAHGVYCGDCNHRLR